MLTGLPGASPNTMASSVATVLERQFTTIAGLDSMISQSNQGSTSITLQFNLSRDIDGAAVDVETAIAAAMPLLPPGMPAPPSFKKQNPGDQPIMFFAADSATMPVGELDEYAERMKNLREESLMAVADHSGTPRGTLRVGANEATCLYVLPEVFGEYCRRYPPVQISIYRNFSYKIVEKLENGMVEVGILTLPIQSPSLKIQPIFRDKLMVMVSPKNPLAKHNVVSVSEIVKHPLLFPKTGHTRRLLDKLFRPHNAQLQIRMELPSIGMIKSFVAADLGVSLISASFARDEVDAGRVKLIELEDAELYRELGLAYRRDITLSVASTAFVGLLRTFATQMKKTNT